MDHISAYSTPVPITILLHTLLVMDYRCLFHDLFSVQKYLVHNGTRVVISTENSCLCIVFNSEIVSDDGARASETNRRNFTFSIPCIIIQ